ncbi:MAG: LysM peptidoglycan-binding domain-containing protein [Ruminococcaceae bacterium]|nr:LysM peptidoglycan-binding domain-containing protein [Oscillospiraceae bacterium]
MNKYNYYKQNRGSCCGQTNCSCADSNGYWVGIYSYKAFLEANISPQMLNRYAVWVAHTGVSQTNFKYQYGIWQYSHTGRVDGIATNVDLNCGYLNYPQMMRFAGLNGFAKVGTGTPVQKPAPSKSVYTVVKNDSLWGIAQKQLGKGSRYSEIKALNSLISNTIHPGQTLLLPEK